MDWLKITREKHHAKLTTGIAVKHVEYSPNTPNPRQEFGLHLIKPNVFKDDVFQRFLYDNICRLRAGYLNN